MTLDNPYAAPQTLEPQLATDEPLPLATLIGRQRYPELDTVTLLRLERLSKALEAATVLWMFPLLASVGPGMVVLLLGRVSSWYTGAAVASLALCVVRLYAGSARRPAHRHVMRWSDGTFLAVIVSGEVQCLLQFGEAPWLVLSFLLVLSSLALLLAQSIRATFYAQELFGPTPYFIHWQLVTEAEQRRKYQIE